MAIDCIICNKPLKGKQSKFCSQDCKSKGQSNNNYINQQNRGWERKRKLIELKGGECKYCNYKRSLIALTFHHRNQKEKLFTLDVRNCSNRTWESLLLEVEKCDLVCANCHAEIEGDINNSNHWL